MNTDAIIGGLIGSVPAALITGLFTLFASNAARRQYRLALFDKQIILFDTTVEFLRLCVTATVTIDNVVAFKVLRNSAYFIFDCDTELDRWLATIEEKGQALSSLSPAEHDETKRRRELLDWMRGEQGKVRQHFEKHLRQAG